MDLPKPAKIEEYSLYAAKLKRVRARELMKHEDDRDKALIEECERTSLYCLERLAELENKEGVKRAPLRRSFVRAVLAAAVVCLILAVSVISYASGRSRLSDKVMWNVRRSLIADGAELRSEEAITRDELERTRFRSEDELSAFFGEGLLLPGSLKGIYFVSAEARGEPGNAWLRCEYRVNGKKLILEADIYSEQRDGSQIETALIYNSEDFSRMYIDGILIGESADFGFVYFSYGSAEYIMVGSQGTEILADIAASMRREGRTR